jgi:hypothetical protein
VWVAYDEWLAAPYADEYEPPECDDCGAWMECEVEADEDGEYLMTWCVRCEEEAA